MFKMKFQTENAAFENDQEVVRILKEVAEKIKNGASGGKIRDINGNTVGSWEVIDEK